MDSTHDSSTSPSGAASLEPTSDKVVRELDVCLSSGVLGSDTKVGKSFCWDGLAICSASNPHAAVLQMYLLQCPLRPPWRPYDLDQCKTVSFLTATAAVTHGSCNESLSQLMPTLVSKCLIKHAGQVQAKCKACRTVNRP